PPSTVVSNKEDVWGEFFLARLLRQSGAKVTSLRLPDLNCRRSTLVAFEDWRAVPEVDPPLTEKEAWQDAQEASRLARQLDPIRRSLPRKRASPKVLEAMELLQERGEVSVTAEVVRIGQERGISKSSLQRGMRRLRGG